MRSVSMMRLELALVLGVFAGCAHAPVKAPQIASLDESDAGLRRDNASLRRRVQMLEDRVLKLERRGEGSGAPVSYDGVDKPTSAERERDPAPEPERRSKALHTEAQGPTSLEPLEHDEYTDDRLWADPSGYDAAEAEEDKRYRLVGQELVRMTEPDRPKPADREPTGAKGKTLKSRYAAAIDLYHAAAYADAEAAFAAIASEYPKSDYADNAWYWKGEAAYDQEHFDDALAAFTAVVERYGGGNKAPDALLKIGLCYDKLGDRANARDVLSQLVSAYPGATASDIARARLAELGT